MAGEIASVISLCKDVATFGRKVHDIARKVSTLFMSQRESLGATLENLNSRVENLGKILEKDKIHNLPGLKDQLDKIKPVFEEIARFLNELKGWSEHDLANKALHVAINFKSTTTKFDNFESTLKGFDEELSKHVPDSILEVVVSTSSKQEEMLKKQDEAFKLQQKFIQDVLTKFEELQKDTEHRALPRDRVLEEKKKLEEFKEDTKYRASLSKRGADHEVNPSELSEEEPLAESARFIYFTAMLEGRKVVIKQIRDVNNQEVDDNFKKEIRNLWSFLRGSILQAYGMWNAKDKKFLVLEYMEKGSLAKVLREEELSLKEKFELAVTAANSLKRIHTKLVHTAVRTDKFLVDKDNTAKLSGLRNSKTFSSCKRLGVASEIANLYLYRAPEMFKPHPFTTQGDIYGFGIVLWEIFTQTKPFSTVFENPTEEDVKEFLKSESQEYKLSMIQDPVADELGDLIRSCRSIQPENRPNISFIVNTLEKLRHDYEKRMNMPE